MFLLHEILMRLYGFAIRIAAFFKPKAKLWIDGRKNVFKDLQESIYVNDKIIWFHCASLGEFEQGRPVIEALRERYPHFKILISFFSPSGFEVRKNYNGADFICYLPLDTRKNAKQFVKIVNPVMAFFVKYEFWPNYLDALHKQGVKTYVFSAIFRKDQIFFKKTGAWMRSHLRKINHLFVQDQQSVDLLKSIGIDQCSISGDTRFDSVWNTALFVQKNKAIENFKGTSKLLVVGSSWPEDEAVIADVMARKNEGLKFIIAPHEIHEDRIKAFIDSSSLKGICYSQIGEKDLSEFDFLMIDSIGMLREVYAYGDIAFIGGGFGKGIHNTLEPAVFAMPICFGPKFGKFREARALIDLKAAHSVETSGELITIVESYLSDNALLEKDAKAAADYVKNNKGATAQILDASLRF